MDIFETIQSEIDNFIDNPIEPVPGYAFNQYDAIKRNHLYYNSIFDGLTEYEGRIPIFDNISYYRKEIASTLLDFDTKDSRLLGLNPKSEMAEHLMTKELQIYLKKHKFDKLYNDIADELPLYGSVVIKKVEDGLKLVDLRRLFLDPAVDTIRDSRFIIIKHYLTAAQLREKRGVWDDEVIDKMLKDPSYLEDEQDSYENSEASTENTKSPYYVVYERYGEVPETFFKKNGKEDNWIRSLFIVTSPEEGGENEILFKSEWKKEYPFLDCHYNKTRGRWLGRGVIEDLWTDQERTNELANQKAVAMDISTLVLFQTSDTTILQNVLRDKRTGDIFKKQAGSDGLQPVNNQMRNIAEYQTEEQKWMSHADAMSFANDVLRGGEIPASMPATNAVIQNNNSTSVFIKKRERIADMLRQAFNEWIFPDLVKSIKKRHILKFSGDTEELQAFDQKIFEPLVNERAKEDMLNGKIVDLEAIRQGVQEELRKKGSSRYVDVIDKMYDDLEFEYDMIIDGQQKNLQTDLSNMFQVLSVLMANPQALDDPRVKTSFYEYMKLAGIDPMKLELADMKRVNQQLSQPQANPLQGNPLVANQPNQANQQLNV